MTVYSKIRATIFLVAVITMCFVMMNISRLPKGYLPDDLFNNFSSLRNNMPVVYEKLSNRAKHMIRLDILLFLGCMAIAFALIDFSDFDFNQIDQGSWLILFLDIKIHKFQTILVLLFACCYYPLYAMKLGPEFSKRTLIAIKILLAYFSFLMVLFFVRIFLSGDNLKNFLYACGLAVITACYSLSTIDAINNDIYNAICIKIIAFSFLSYWLMSWFNIYISSDINILIGFCLFCGAAVTFIELFFSSQIEVFKFDLPSLKYFLGLFLFQVFLAVATFQCISKISQESTVFESPKKASVIAPFACFFIASCGLCLIPPSAKTAAVKNLGYALFAIFSLLGVFFAFRLAQEIIFSSDKNLGSGAASGFGQAQSQYNPPGVGGGAIPVAPGLF